MGHVTQKTNKIGLEKPILLKLAEKPSLGLDYGPVMPRSLLLNLEETISSK